MVPNGWIHTTFEKHIDCLTGYAFKSSNYSDSPSDIKLLRGDNIEPGSLRWRDAKYWSINQLDGLERYQLNKGDFVVALDRTWISSGLKVAEVRSEDLPCLLVQRVIRVRAKKTLEQGLLRQYFSGHKFEQYVKSVQTATAVPHISPNDIKEFPLFLPPLAEQQKIAQILSTWDQAISATEKLLENSQQQKKALMQQLLTGKRRLLDENGARFSGEWKSTKVKAIFKPEVLSAGNQDFPIFSVTKNGLVNQSEYFNKSVASEDTSKYRVVKTGRFVMSGLNFWMGSVDVHLMDFPVIVSPAYKVFVITNLSSPEFMKHFIRSSLFQKVLEAASVVGASVVRRNFSESIFNSYELFIPEIAEQEKIAAVLSAADQEIEGLQKKLDCLKQEKKALMQQLLTGKKRVKVAA